ncbi:hypothetical protein FHR83_006816 [Actinoplanes campanulatus]|uniref:Uncharacterized protein n=1 Tax=Actinoplanes campanulatus TaxID=113559 RepID=A0A7W5AN31_9ACTN|nr:hypothetical protein [Actinoplanes campanulatus]MBB3099110.1 hypothetical protein [Actinoplanes campanulatus]GGN38991.1 hypothetical protein GCM10010109_66430 [Actinoplanes campanulatus]GID40266.1 hypothetical protein Aca09nite_67720 [Actinoplanes campanulatus]
MTASNRDVHARLARVKDHLQRHGFALTADQLDQMAGGASPNLFKSTEPRCDPDQRCEATTTVDMPHGVDEPYQVDCVLEDAHDPHADPDDYAHTDGDGTWWNTDGDIEYR